MKATGNKRLFYLTLRWLGYRCSVHTGHTLMITQGQGWCWERQQVRTKEHPYCCGVPKEINIPLLCSCVMGISPHCAHLLRVPCVLEQGFSIQQCWCFDQNNILRWSRSLCNSECSMAWLHLIKSVGLSLSSPTSGREMSPRVAVCTPG